MSNTLTVRSKSQISSTLANKIQTLISGVNSTADAEKTLEEISALVYESELLSEHRSTKKIPEVADGFKE